MVRVNFETSQDAICGIELTASGQKVAWSIASYLAALGEEVGALVDAHSSATMKATPEPDAVKAPEPDVAALAGAK